MSDMTAIEKILVLDSTGDLSRIMCEPYCPECRIEMERTDNIDEGDFYDMEWKCPCCGMTVPATDLDDGYAPDYIIERLKSEALEMGYVYDDIYADFHRYDENDDSDKEYAKIYG